MTPSELQAIAEKEYPYSDLPLNIKFQNTYDNHKEYVDEQRNTFLKGLQYATPAAASMVKHPLELVCDIGRVYENVKYSSDPNDWTNALVKIMRLLAEQSPSPMPAKEDWIELKEGQPLPDYDEPALWLSDDGNVHVDSLDKDGNPHIFEGYTLFGQSSLIRTTHWHKLPPLPSPPAFQPLTKE